MQELLSPRDGFSQQLIACKEQFLLGFHNLCFSARRFITDADIEDPAVTETDIEDSEDANTDIEDPEVSENTDPRNARANNADSDDDGAYYNNSLIPAVEIVYGNKHGYETNNVSRFILFNCNIFRISDYNLKVNNSA